MKRWDVMKYVASGEIEEKVVLQIDPSELGTATLSTEAITSMVSINGIRVFTIGGGASRDRDGHRASSRRPGDTQVDS